MNLHGSFAETLKFILDSFLSPSTHQSIRSQFLRQLLSGSAAAATDLSVFQCSLWLRAPIWLAATLSFAFAVAVNFSITRRYVFRRAEKPVRQTQSQFLRYLLLALSSLGLTQLILFVFAVRMGFPPLPVKALAIPAIFFWNMLAYRYLVFK